VHECVTGLQFARQVRSLDEVQAAMHRDHHSRSMDAAKYPSKFYWLTM
jgi:hypothetical protein